MTSERLETGGLPAGGLLDDLIGRVRFAAHSRNGKPIFIGIGPRRAVDAYLSGVARTQVTDLSDPSTATASGMATRLPATPPAAQSFWTSSSSSAGATHIDWKIAGPQARLVVMNADASPGVAADLNVGVKTDLGLWAGLVLAILGLAGLGGSIAALAALRTPRQRP